MIIHTALFALSALFAAAAAAPSPSPQGTSQTRPSCGQDGYDYIIVGGGTAGNALAARLSQGLPSASILVIEAGPAAPDELAINVPGRKGSTLGTRFDWNFTTVPQPGLRNRLVGVNRGKVLGGSSALNLMCWDRASSVEYDAWEDVGNPGWNWRTMDVVMTRAENYTGGPPSAGKHGPVHSIVNRVVPAHQQGWIPTLHDSFGIQLNQDSLNGHPIGVSLQPSSIDPSHYNRSYSANAYLSLAGRNLRVLTDTLVARITLRKTGPAYVATGVLLANGSSISARKEVILSAGTIQSPMLLELSGIGSSSVLATANITQVIDLPGVGENLQDHIRCQASYQLKPGYTSFDIFRHNSTAVSTELNKWLAGEVSLYDYTASGFLFANWSQIAGSDGAARLAALARSTLAGSTHPVDRKKAAYLTDPLVPQVEVIFSDGYTGVKGYPAPGTPLYGQGFFTLIAALMHPLARGSVHIGSDSPAAKPVIDPNYLSSEYEVQALVAAMKFVRAVANTAPLRDVWVSEYEPGLAAVPEGSDSDAAWRDFVLNTTLSVFHPTGSCAMLPRREGGVVDARLVVYGVENLRVVDASVFPVQVSAHIQTAVYGVAERAAEMIIADAKGKNGGDVACG